jgi:hypothetical protein
LVAKAVKLRTAGRTLREIAVALKVPKSTIGRTLRHNATRNALNSNGSASSNLGSVPVGSLRQSTPALSNSDSAGVTLTTLPHRQNLVLVYEGPREGQRQKGQQGGPAEPRMPLQGGLPIWLRAMKLVACQSSHKKGWRSTLGRRSHRDSRCNYTSHPVPHKPHIDRRSFEPR